MAALSGRRRGGSTRSSKANNRRKIRIRVRQGARVRRTNPIKPVVLPSARSNGNLGLSEMDRSNPQFQAALKIFGEASRCFAKANFGKARELFEKVAGSPARELAVRARVHVALCDKKLGHSAPPPRSAAEYYDLGVAQLNARRLDLAVEYLGKANKSEAHVQYALAAAHALQGNGEIAFEHLQSAIQLHPGNRFQVRFDDDFKLLAADPRFKRLVYASNGREL